MFSPRGEWYIWFVQHNQGTPISEVILPTIFIGYSTRYFLFTIFAMHFFKVRKIINYLPTHLKSGNMNPGWPNTMFQAKWHRCKVANSYSEYQVRVITVFTVFRLLTDFVCLYNYEFWLSLCKIVRSSVILLLPLLAINIKWAIMTAMSSRVTLWWDDNTSRCNVLGQWNNSAHIDVSFNSSTLF